MGQNALIEQIYGKSEQDRRRVPREVRKTHDLVQLHQGHHEVINLRLLGYSQKEIAARTGYTTTAVNLILGSRLAELKLKQLRLARDGKVLDVAKKIHEELVPKAMEIYERILNAYDGEGGISIELQKKTADTIVKDLAGLAAPKELRINGTMTHEVLQRITERGKEAMRACGLLAEPVTDAEVVEDAEDPGEGAE